MGFECSQCGECCSHLGQVFQIIETYEDYSFLVLNIYTGTKQVVTVNPVLVHLYEDQEIFIRRPKSCPFFRQNPADKIYYCTVHLSRPDICREYGCWRILILDAHGNRVGRIMQNRHLDAQTPHLRYIWDTHISTIHEPDDRIWDRKACDILRKAGFTIRT